MYKRTGWQLLILLIALLNGCGVPGGGQALPFHTLSQGDGLDPQGRDKPVLFVIADAKEIDSFAQNVAKVEPQLDDQRQRLVDQVQKQDYQHVFVILALQGTRTGGARVTVQQVTRQDDRVVIQAQFFTPPPGQPRPTIQTDPYHLIAVAKEGSWGRPIQFELLADGKQVAVATHVIP